MTTFFWFRLRSKCPAESLWHKKIMLSIRKCDVTSTLRHQTHSLKAPSIKKIERGQLFFESHRLGQYRSASAASACRWPAIEMQEHKFLSVLNTLKREHYVSIIAMLLRVLL
jgi:hypothetical protein